jgi:hypothetical protein
LRTKLLLVTAIAACIWTSGARLQACGCGESRLPCEAAWEATAVFVGALVSIVDETPEPRRDPLEGPPPPSRRLTFRVTEPFRGVSAPQVLIYADGRSSCTMPLTTGEVYLVYAFPLGEGRLYTHYCSRTRPAAHASDDLQYLRGSARQASGLGTIQGVTRQPDLQPKEYYNFDEEPAYAGARVLVEAVDPKRPARYEATTGPDGRYSVRVPVGKYHVALTVRDGLWAAGPFRQLPLEVRDPRGCASADFTVYPDGRIGGRVLDVDGRPVPALAVDLSPVDDVAKDSYASRYQARTDVAGEFEFTRLRPGAYVVGVSLYRLGGTDERAVWLTQASGATRPRIGLAAEQRVWAGELHLPRAVELTRVTGSVSDADGRVPRAARVRVLADPGAGDADAGVTTVDAAGGFTFTLIAGRTYRLIAERNFEPGTARVQVLSDLFKAVAGPMSFALRFEK